MSDVFSGDDTTMGGVCGDCGTDIRDSSQFTNLLGFDTALTILLEVDDLATARTRTA
jgi:hypothetical protein